MQVEPPSEVASEVRSRIVVAAAGLLRADGARAVTTRAVARAADVQPPTIFRLFGDKDGLLQAVAEHVVAEYTAAKTARVREEDGDPVDDLRAAWRAHIEFGLANPEVFQLLTVPGRLQNSPAAAAGEEVLRVRVGRVAAAGYLTVPEARAVAMIRAAGTGAVLSLLSVPPEDRDAGLADALMQAVLGTILASTPAPPASDAVAVVNAFRAALPALPALSDAERTLLSEWLARSVAALPA